MNERSLRTSHPRRGSSGIVGSIGRRSSRPSGAGRLAASIAVVLLGTIAITSAAVNPNLIGTFFTIFVDVRDGVEVYKIEAQVTNIRVTGPKTAEMDIEIRVTNNHPFDIHVTSAFFHVLDLAKRRTTMIFALTDVTIPAGQTVIAQTTALVFRVLGIGNRYLVEGTINWEEIRDGVVHEFFKEIREVHSIQEFV